MDLKNIIVIRGVPYIQLGATKTKIRVVSLDNLNKFVDINRAMYSRTSIDKLDWISTGINFNYVNITVLRVDQSIDIFGHKRTKKKALNQVFEGRNCIIEYGKLCKKDGVTRDTILIPIDGINYRFVLSEVDISLIPVDLSGLKPSQPKAIKNVDYFYKLIPGKHHRLIRNKHLNIPVKKEVLLNRILDKNYCEIQYESKVYKTKIKNLKKIKVC
jgi:lysine/ornithine N-monooxygenase